MITKQAVETIMHRCFDSIYLINSITKAGRAYVITGVNGFGNSDRVSIHLGTENGSVEFYEEKSGVCRNHTWPLEYYEKKRDGVIFAIDVGVRVNYYYGQSPGEIHHIFVYHVKSRDKKLVCFTDGIRHGRAMPLTAERDSFMSFVARNVQQRYRPFTEDEVRTISASIARRREEHRRSQGATSRDD
jgi:hypothetical protein